MLNPWIGELGRLMEVPFTAKESIAREDRYITNTTVEGRRRAQLRAATPRSWTVNVPLGESPDMVPLDGFASGGWGPGPWHWIPVQAQRGNLLTPGEALLLDRSTVAGLVDGPPVLGVDGTWAPRSLTISISSSAAVFVRGIPVIPGMPVTYSAEVERRTGAPGLTVGFYNAAGGSAGALSGYGTATAGMQRVSLSGVAPANAVSMGIGVRTETARIARPQVTWTPGPVPYSPGHGCRSAIVDGISQDLLAVTHRGLYTTTEFTVMEVS